MLLQYRVKSYKIWQQTYYHKMWEIEKRGQTGKRNSKQIISEHFEVWVAWEFEIISTVNYGNVQTSL